MICSHPNSLARRTLRALTLTLALGGIAPSALAQETLDPAAAREHLTQGYKLKQQGQLKEALPHLIESWRLDPKLKTLINLADCEEKLGMLVEAQGHWLAARDRAGREGEARIKQESEGRVSALDSRLPRLTIQLSPGVPTEAQIYRDDVLLGRVSLGVALPTNPGEHTILVHAAGKEDWKYTVKLAERDNQIVTANVGPAGKTPLAPFPEGNKEPSTAAPTLANVAPAPPPPLPAPSTSSSPSSGLADEPAPSSASNSTGSTQRVLGLVTGGLGIVSFGVAVLYWSQASSDVRAEDDGRKKAKDDLLLTNVSLVAGCVLLTGGAILYFTAPRAPKTAWRVLPSVGLAGNRPVIGAVGQF